MDEITLSLVAKMHATNARIEAMKAGNAAAVARGFQPQWDFGSFSAEAAILDMISEDLRSRAG